MRLLMLAQFFPPDIGGEERHVLNLSNALASRGHEVSVATQLLPGTVPFEVLPSGVTVHRFASSAMRLNRWYSDTCRPHHLPVPDPRLTAELSSLIARERPAVVHAHNWMVNSAVAVRRHGAGRHRFGLVLTLHDYSNVCATKRMMRHGEPCAGPRMAQCLACAGAHYGPVVGAGTALAVPLMRRWKEHAVDHIVSVSTAVAARNAVAEANVPSSVVPNFVPDELTEWATPARQGDAACPPMAGEFLFFAGDLRPDKGVSTLLRSYAMLGDGCPPMLMVGRRCQQTPTTLPRGVSVKERWPHEQIMAAFRSCVMAVLPSVWPDPCPTTVLEAMAAGCPVITSRTGGMVDMVEDGVSGLLVRPGDVEDLARAMGRLLADQHLRRRVARAGQASVVRFTASAVAAQLESIYREVAAR